MNKKIDYELVEKLEDRLNSIRAELDSSEKERKKLDEQIAELSREVGYIDGLLAIHGRTNNAVNAVPTQKPSPSKQPLPLTELADAVVELLRETGEPMYYKKIAGILEERGIYKPTGKDAASSLLVRYYNDQRLYRPRRGHYAVKAEAK